MKYNFELLNTIKEFGKDLISIDLLIVGANPNDTFESVQYILDVGVPEADRVINYIIEGCPKLKSLTLESFRGWTKESPKAKISSISWMSHDSYDSDLFEDYDSDISWDVSFDDGEQESNSGRSDESDENETLDILDNFDGDEFELMFSENYGEDNKDEIEE